MPRGFPRSDYLERTARAQALMAERELALLWYSTEAEIRYFTGFLTQFWESPTRPWYLLIPAAGHPVAVIPGIGAALMGETWIADIRTWSAPSPGDDGESLLADAIAELSPPSGRIGTRMGIESLVRMPLDQLRGLERAVAPRTIVDDGGIAARLRAVKSEAEIDKIRTACTIAGHAFARVPEFAREGTPLDQVFRRFQAICLEEGADRVAYSAGGAGVDGYADVISPPGETPLVKGDLVMIDTGVVHDGYFADYDRNYSVGKPSEAGCAVPTTCSMPRPRRHWPSRGPAPRRRNSITPMASTLPGRNRRRAAGPRAGNAADRRRVADPAGRIQRWRRAW